MPYTADPSINQEFLFEQSSAPAASALRREIGARNVAWAEAQKLLHESSIGLMPIVLYREDDSGRHGNFHPVAYRQIQRKAEWRARLQKTHTTARRILVGHESRCELDSCNSSDALLMNIFCHPQNLKIDSRLRGLLGLNPDDQPVFGYKPLILLKNGRYDRTEIDLRIGNLLIEAKLTEHDFQTARSVLVERYRDLEEIFDIHELPRSGDLWLSYQLLRGALAAYAEKETRFCVLCDARRPDIIADWYRILRCVRSSELRCRLSLLTWQEIASICPRTLRQWLMVKYGINPSVADQAWN